MKKALLVLFCSFIFALSFNVNAQTRGLPDFTELVEKQGASVVNISTTQIIRDNRNGQGAFPLDENDPMFEFFRRFMPRQPGIPGAPNSPNQPNQPRESESHSLGSGFIISNDGYILTNAHVIDSADEIVVRLTDKRELKAKLIGSDKRTDIALIKIEAKNLPAVQLGNPNDLKVGEWVVAIGSPFGFDNSVTAGIVSAKGRSLPQENFVPFIQTDVAVNPGNSGGPLFNLKGEVVGINSQIYSRSGGFMGISFAIPIDVALEVQRQLRLTGKVSRGRIGVVIQDLTKELADSLGLAKAQGALINRVEKGGPADKAGLEAGDVVLKFDGKNIESPADLTRAVGNTQPNSKATLQIWRNKATREIPILIGAIPEENAPNARADKGERTPKTTDYAAVKRLGLELSDLNAEQRARAAANIMVDNASGNAARANLQRGDLILAIVVQGRAIPLQNVAQLNGLLQKIDARANVSLLIKREEAQIFVTIRGS